MCVEWIKVTLAKVDYSKLNRKSELLAVKNNLDVKSELMITAIRYYE